MVYIDIQYICTWLLELGLTVFFSASISQLRDWICLLDSLASCLACLRESELRFADSVRSVNCRGENNDNKCHRIFICDCEWSVFVYPPWTCTIPQIPACSWGQWSRIGPWCPSVHQWGLVWCCCPPPSSAAGSGPSLGLPGFPVSKYYLYNIINIK